MPKSTALTQDNFAALSDFRYQLRRFLRVSEELAHAEGMTALQYQLLLHIKGHPDPAGVTVSELAERLQAQQHGTVALITRCAAAGWVTRCRSAQDRRQVLVQLTAEGERRVRRLAELHRSEVSALATVLAGH